MKQIWFGLIIFMTLKIGFFMKKILVLCTGNSCRSIMAEAIINHRSGGCFWAVSAGSKPAGVIHPQTLETLARHGIPVENLRSKFWDEFEGQAFDLVITVCDQAATESCPVLMGRHQKLHWSTPDPAHVKGSSEEIHKAFDDAFFLLYNRIEHELLNTSTE